MRSPEIQRLGRAIPPVAPGLLAAAIFLVALNLRAPITSVPPLVPAIERELGLSGAQVGLLTTLPVLCMGLFAPVAQRLAHRLGHESALAWALVSILAGTLLRLGGHTPALLFGGTFLAGVGIAVGGAVLPGIVKEFFGGRSGLLTGLYMGGMIVGAAIASLLAVPLAEWFGSWPTSLAVWAALPFVSLTIWLPITRKVNTHDDAGDTPTHDPFPWRQATAWLVTGYLIVQSTQFYTQLAWIPATYEARGWAESATGLLLVAFMVAQGFSGVGGPAFADHLRDLRPLITSLVLISLIGTTGVAFAPDLAPYAWVVMMGFGLAGSFALGLVLLVRYASSPAASARLTAMAFLVSYGAAAVGPTGFGAIRDATDSFQLPWIILVVLGVLQIGLIIPLHSRRRLVV